MLDGTLLPAHTGSLVHEHVLQALLGSLIGVGPVVPFDDLGINDQLVLVQHRLEGGNDAFFLSDRSPDLLNVSIGLLLDQVSFEELTDHPVTKVGFNEEGTGLVLLSDPNDLREGLIAVAVSEGDHIPNEDVTIGLGHDHGHSLVEAPTRGVYGDDGFCVVTASGIDEHWGIPTITREANGGEFFEHITWVRAPGVLFSALRPERSDNEIRKPKWKLVCIREGCIELELELKVGAAHRGLSFHQLNIREAGIGWRVRFTAGFQVLQDLRGQEALVEVDVPGIAGGPNEGLVAPLSKLSVAGEGSLGSPEEDDAGGGLGH